MGVQLLFGFLKGAAVTLAFARSKQTAESILHRECGECGDQEPPENLFLPFETGLQLQRPQSGPAARLILC